MPAVGTSFVMKPLPSCLLALATIFGIRAAAQPADAPPNVVIIISDDQAWTDYGFMGHPKIATPRLDRLAQESLVFRRGYVPTSLCCPSLASLITGLYPHEHRITGNEPPRAKSVKRSSAEFRAACEAMDDFIEKVPTLPRVLAKHDYLSFQSGKWWHGSFRRGGFSHGMTHGDPDRGGRHGDDGLRIGREGLDPIANFIDLALEEERPFFVWYAPFLPHTPHTPPKRLLDKYRDEAPSLPVAKYWAMCEWFDETCGELLDLLDDKAVSERTLVLYVCDNGWINREDASRYAPRSKRSPYEGGVRTPILVRWPGHVAPGESEALASSLDFYPTILEACGLSTDRELPGTSLLDAEQVAARPRIFGEIFLHDARELDRPSANLTYRWCIEGNWKLIAPHADNVEQAELELYDLKGDPTETINLAAQEPDIVNRLITALNANWVPSAK